MGVRFKTAGTNADQILEIVQQYDQENIQPQLTDLEENSQDANLEVTNTPDVDPNSYNDLGVLTEDVTINYPTTDPNVIQHYQGQFTVDPDGNYTVDFGSVIMTGDTEIHNYSTYVFDIVGDHGTLKEYRYGGFFGKVVSGFSGTSVIVNVNGTNENISVDENGWFFSLIDENTTSIAFNTSDKTNFEQLYLSGIKAKLTTAVGMFSGCKNLTILDVSRLNTSEITNMASMFDNCQKIENLDLSNFDTSKVTTMLSMFNYCKALKKIDVSNFDTSNVTNMSSMFSICQAITSLDLSNFNTSKVTNMSSMFYFDTNLTLLNVSNFDTSNVTNMSSMFSNLTKLINLDVSSFVTEKVTNMSSMFSTMSKLSKIDLSNFNTSIVTNMSSMFANTPGLSKLDLSSFNVASVTNFTKMFDSSHATIINLDNWIMTNGATTTDMFKQNTATTIYLRNSDTDTYNMIDAVKPAGATIITAA